MKFILLAVPQKWLLETRVLLPSETRVDGCNVRTKTHVLRGVAVEKSGKPLV
jgi:hypothetical protein